MVNVRRHILWSLVPLTLFSGWIIHESHVAAIAVTFAPSLRSVPHSSATKIPVAAPPDERPHEEVAADEAMAAEDSFVIPAEAMPRHSDISGFTEHPDIDSEALQPATAEQRWLALCEARGYPRKVLFTPQVFDMNYGVKNPNWTRFYKHGYKRSHVRYYVRNHLYSESPPDPEVTRLSDSLEELDDTHLAAAKQRNKSVSKMSKMTRKAMRKGGVGATGRGWGITASATNKWRFYHKYVVRAREMRRAANETLRMAEVGMLAGHSTTLLLNIGKRYGTSVSMQVFDLLQPGTWWGKVAEPFLAERFDFNVMWGDSGKTLPEYRKQIAAESGNCDRRKFDFISLDGYKGIVMSDLFHLRELSFPHTVLIFDDVKSTSIRAGSPQLNTPEAVQRLVAAGDAEYPTFYVDRLKYHIARGELELLECWDPDINFPMYGNCAIRFNHSAPLTIPSKVAAEIDMTPPKCTS